MILASLYSIKSLRTLSLWSHILSRTTKSSLRATKTALRTPKSRKTSTLLLTTILKLISWLTTSILYSWGWLLSVTRTTKKLWLTNRSSVNSRYSCRTISSWLNIFERLRSSKLLISTWFNLLLYLSKILNIFLW